MNECRVSLLPANKKFGAKKETELVRVTAPGRNETLMPNPMIEAARFLFSISPTKEKVTSRDKGNAMSSSQNY